MLDGNPHELEQRAHAKLGLELSASIGDRLVAHMQMFGDYAIGLAFLRRGGACSPTKGGEVLRPGTPTAAG